MKISTEEKSSLVARYQAGESANEICTSSGVPRSTFYTWIKPHTMTTTDSGVEVSQQAFVKLNQKLHKLEQKLEILQKVDCTTSVSRLMTNIFMSALFFICFQEKWLHMGYH